MIEVENGQPVLPSLSHSPLLKKNLSYHILRKRNEKKKEKEND
jgi:hypothetical protein